MGAAIAVYHLVRYDGIDAACQHYLLLRVTQREFANWSETQHENAASEQFRKRDGLIAADQKGRLARECLHRHRVTQVGEFQGFPQGDALYALSGEIELDIWVAETRFGAPWILFGVAASEDEFWRDIAEDEDLIALGPKQPARLIHVHFVMEADQSQPPSVV